MRGCEGYHNPHRLCRHSLQDYQLCLSGTLANIRLMVVSLDDSAGAESFFSSTLLSTYLIIDSTRVAPKVLGTLEQKKGKPRPSFVETRISNRQKAKKPEQMCDNKIWVVVLYYDLFFFFFFLKKILLHVIKYNIDRQCTSLFYVNQA